MQSRNAVEFMNVVCAFVFVVGVVLTSRTLAAEKTQDYTSKVPEYEFADTLAEQEAQLKTNPLLLRFNESRRKQADDPYRHREFGRRHEYARKLSSVISIDSSRSSMLADVASCAPETAQVSIEKDQPLKLRVFVDRSVVEVFVNGKQCVAQRVYPGRQDSVGVSLRAQGRDAVLKSLDAWQMKNICE